MAGRAGFAVAAARQRTRRHCPWLPRPTARRRLRLPHWPPPLLGRRRRSGNLEYLRTLQILICMLVCWIKLELCDGLPLAISTIGGYLANKPKTSMEWRKLNDGLSAELEINPKLKMIKTVLMRSYSGLPYHLKATFLYFSVFPEDHIIQRKRMVRRWIAEGYSREMQNMTAEQVGDNHFEELVDRSMILPLDIGIFGKVNACQLHDLIREICVSKAREENLVFTLEEGCSLGSTQGAVRHLTISSNWKRDKDVMERMLDLSRIRSLTVFGEWRSFFISDKTRFLRVLDLEHTTGLRDHHLDKIGMLFHLRYLSLRGCKGIFRLPDSLANLGQLQTLDARGTRICTLPSAVAKLKKLQHFHASGLPIGGRSYRDQFYMENEWLVGDYSITGDPRCPGPCCLLALCFAMSTCCQLPLPSCFLYGHRGTALLRMSHVFCRSQLLEPTRLSRQDLCPIYHYYNMVVEKERGMLCGVRVPRGISKLKALHTLRVVNVARGKDTTFEELRGLTQLRKLGVVGVQDGNCNEMFWRSIAGHDRLQSLSAQVYDSASEGQLDCSLGGGLCPPKCLESLKMIGRLVNVTEWIHGLQNLLKLQLEKASLKQDDLEAIGMLPNLAVLRLKDDSPMQRHLCFRRSSFSSLLLVEFRDLWTLTSVEFEEQAMPKLEVLSLQVRRGIFGAAFSHKPQGGSTECTLSQGKSAEPT